MSTEEELISIALFGIGADIAIIETTNGKFIGGSNGSFTSYGGPCNWRHLDYPELLFAKRSLNARLNQMFWEAKAIKGQHDGRFIYIDGELTEVDSVALVNGE